MGDVPSTTNQAATLVNQAVQTVIQRVGEPALEAACITAQPWLGWLGVNWVFGWVCDWFAGKFYTVSAKQLTSVVIDLQINGEKSAANQAVQGMQQAAQSGDPSAMAQSTQAFEDAFGRLAHYDGSASP